MNTPFTGKRNKRGDWSPNGKLANVPLFVWPPRPMAILKWLFGYPGYFFPWGIFYMAFPILTWFFLTPPMEEMKTFEWDWIAYIFARNIVMLSVVMGIWHVRLHTLKAQGTDFKYTNKWFLKDSPRFLFKNQLLSNLFWTYVSGVPIWTAYEVVTMWAYANGFMPYLDWDAHPVYGVLLMCAIPMFHSVHFYFIHRAIHWGPLYRMVHYIHHENVDVGPTSGLVMHPVEHLLYWSSVLIHFVVPSHPIHILFQLQYSSLQPAQGHAGFERVVLPSGNHLETHDYYHYLHHKYLECNYGGDGPFALDKWFGTMNDGTPESTEAMNNRFLAAARKKQAKAQAKQERKTQTNLKQKNETPEEL
ncbi:Sterol desaturase/sphingolipid hydroxylase, fatty acid hydroxylase superfamily [Pseudomonas syringae]|uniref:sterol desaturase family protein n=1 Tax=Pseudomonas syringae group TaxID=136849 RepID=UPI00089CAB77|nr:MULTISPECIES: sterol desaturase family protein [Pseudomonas syringae group]RMN40287.1 hypothetical protein ALQ59_200170 [Pseudomonas syringae pv. apii]RMN56167.1 hypothetical protein ALQ58_200085 [Pseudomonas syringae pv. apii]SDZ38695.1 Sterol desaturase/sphingolipid hydroxylase, fatty acid hydroxylase superfamily [Pseudomonas syringae]